MPVCSRTLDVVVIVSRGERSRTVQVTMLNQIACVRSTGPERFAVHDDGEGGRGDGDGGPSRSPQSPRLSATRP